MLLLKFLLITAGDALLVTAALVLGFDVYQYIRSRRRIEAAESGTEKLTEPELKLRARLAGYISGAGLVLLLLATTFDVVPAGHAAILVSQISGTEPTTLYPGIHFKSPLKPWRSMTRAHTCSRPVTSIRVSKARKPSVTRP